VIVSGQLLVDINSICNVATSNFDEKSPDEP